MSTRDGELYKDKVEVSLDGRQIFYLFFGGAVIVGMVFVLGVLVGRRVEARGHVDRAHTAAASDPLAALDRLESSDGMAFRGALSGQASEAPVDKAIAELAEKRGTAPVADVKKTDKKVDDKVAKTEDKKDEKKSDDKKSDEKKSDKKDEKKKAEAKSEEPTSDAKVQAKSDDKKSDRKSDDKVAKSDDKKADEKKSDDKVEKKDEKKERYTLQLSSFQDKTEAETFLDSMKAKGFNASITTAEVDGKGTFYRVRMGTYRSLDAATSAKSDFEKAASHNASIMKI
ncbi:MAG TPA: SPOR domain-containing protein [Kofleriaceae bacterium]|jgi:cell division protein FtsN